MAPSFIRVRWISPGNERGFREVLLGPDGAKYKSQDAFLVILTSLSFAHSHACTSITPFPLVFGFLLAPVAPKFVLFDSD